MKFERFGLMLTVRLVFVLASLTAAGYLAIAPGQHPATILAFALGIGLTFEMFSFISKTNHELSRFLDAVRYADFGQRFEFKTTGGGFAELGSTFTAILERFREDRRDHERELRHLKALLEHVPVPLISIHSDESITLWNNAARRLFGNVRVRSVRDLEVFGEEFAAAVERIRPGRRVLVDYQQDETVERLSVSASEITIASATERLVSLQNIQSELDDVQLSAWRDLVRVLTHEITNSITPVASLAHSAVDLVEDVNRKVNDPDVREELSVAQDAVNTVARRSDGLVSFISSYKQLTRLPEPHKSRFAVAELFDDVTKTVAAGWDHTGPTLHTEVSPTGLAVNADRQMIEQVLINLLQNSASACRGIENAAVALTGRLNRQGSVGIDVTDNGPGVADEIASKIFVPFFTTRSEGTGVGLALSRQIMLAHGGTISLARGEARGAKFTLSF